ncbi:MAG: glucuronate isomerase [Armatimonadetes bacterium]|nr:glucuronate isomerase [Armatimonadota bacterium]
MGFIDEEFLLGSDEASRLYHEYAEGLPIVDFHCHLPPAQIASNHTFRDLTEIWLEGDHYKWRAMRANGVAERFCTGDAAPREKHQAWMETLPYTLRNPLYHWSHLEVWRYFGVTGLLTPDRAEEVWDTANTALKGLSTQKILERDKVAVVCTTDDPADSLEHHEACAGLKTRILPTYRPDRAMWVDRPDVFIPWIQRLSETSGEKIFSLDHLLTALKKRHDDFHAVGGRLSDHGVPTVPTETLPNSELQRVFVRAATGHPATPDEQRAFARFILEEVAGWNAEKGWTMQFHLGPVRNTNPRAFAELGPDTGYDSIGDFRHADGLMGLLGSLEAAEKLPKVILYNNNPTDNYVFATMAQNYPQAGVPGRMQFGAGWWHLDQRDGIRMQLDALSNCGLLRRFVGMLTDSRSFLSYTRHEYFRRVLCDILGSEMRDGLLPMDFDLVGSMVREVCYTNARDHFGFDIDKSFAD